MSARTVLTRRRGPGDGRRRPGVDQIVNRIPGNLDLHRSDRPAPSDRPSPSAIRGFGSSTTINTLVMVDGRADQRSRIFRTVDWSRISKNSVERIRGHPRRWAPPACGGNNGDGAASSTSSPREPTKTGVAADRGATAATTRPKRRDGQATVKVNDSLKVGVGLQPCAEQRLQPDAGAVPERQTSCRRRSQGRQTSTPPPT